MSNPRLRLFQHGLRLYVRANNGIIWYGVTLDLASEPTFRYHRDTYRIDAICDAYIERNGYHGMQRSADLQIVFVAEGRQQGRSLHDLLEHATDEELHQAGDLHFKHLRNGLRLYAQMDNGKVWDGITLDLSDRAPIFRSTLGGYSAEGILGSYRGHNIYREETRTGLQILFVAEGLYKGQSLDELLRTLSNEQLTQVGCTIATDTAAAIKALAKAILLEDSELLARLDGTIASCMKEQAALESVEEVLGRLEKLTIALQTKKAALAAALI